MRMLGLKIGLLVFLGIGSLSFAEAPSFSSTRPYQGCLQELAPHLHPSASQDLTDFEEHLKGVEGAENHAFIVKTFIEVVKANPGKYIRDFGSTAGLVQAVTTDPLFLEKCNEFIQILQARGE